jgi:hypothetical protein
MVDIDDVIFPTMASIHARAQEKGLHDGTAKMRWSGWESYALPNGDPCPPEVYWDLWSEFALDDGYINTPPIDDAVNALRWLYWEGHTIHLVTARGFMAHADDIRRWTKEWVDEYAIPHETLTFAQDKVEGMITALGGWTPPDARPTFDSAIDDSPKNVQALRNAGVRAYLLNHEHNEDADIPADWRTPSLWEWAYIIEKERVA